jgi:hypothetical protein
LAEARRRAGQGHDPRLEKQERAAEQLRATTTIAGLLGATSC